MQSSAAHRCQYLYCCPCSAINAIKEGRAFHALAKQYSYGHHLSLSSCFAHIIILFVEWHSLLTIDRVQCHSPLLTSMIPPVCAVSPRGVVIRVTRGSGSVCLSLLGIPLQARASFHLPLFSPFSSSIAPQPAPTPDDQLHQTPGATRESMRREPPTKHNGLAEGEEA